MWPKSFARIPLGRSNDYFLPSCDVAMEQKPGSKDAAKCPYGWGRQPAVLVLCSVHVPVEGVELFVAEVIHVQQVKLAPRIVVALVVPCSGEIQPLGMAKLIPCNTQSGKESQCGAEDFWIQIRPGDAQGGEVPLGLHSTSKQKSRKDESIPAVLRPPGHPCRG